MARTRRARAELTESWEDVDNSYFAEGGDGEPIYDEEEERDEMGSQYSQYRDPDSPRRRTERGASSNEPELVMPSSPDAAVRRVSNRVNSKTPQRASTPHFRMNQRSLTSDAGEIRKKQRAATPRQRMADRSMTSDAGRMGGSRLREQHDVDDEATGSQYPALLRNRALGPLLRYVTDVVGYSLQYLKPLLGWLLLLYVLLAAMVFGSGFLTNSISNALSPVCRLPFTSSLPFCPIAGQSEPKGLAEYDKLVLAQDAFQDVLANTAVGVNLPLDMKRCESGIRDLKQLVAYSSLPSRNELVFEFGGFIDTARQAANDLSKFNSRIGRAVDKILSTNKWTLNVIEGVAVEESSRGAISGWMSRNLNIFAPFQPVGLASDVLLDQYLRHTGAIEEQIKNLMDEAFILRDVLENLDGRLEVIADIAHRDGVKTESHQDELFGQLWTKLGGNRASTNKIQQQLELLNSVAHNRRAAWGHVTSTILKLQEISHSLDDLRERLAVPAVVGSEKVPLAVHIESINMGIERLESQRNAGRSIAADTYSKIAAKAEAGDRDQIGGGEL